MPNASRGPSHFRGVFFSGTIFFSKTKILVRQKNYSEKTFFRGNKRKNAFQRHFFLQKNFFPRQIFFPQFFFQHEIFFPFFSDNVFKQKLFSKKKLRAKIFFQVKFFSRDKIICEKKKFRVKKLQILLLEHYVTQNTLTKFHENQIESFFLKGWIILH